MKYKTTAKAIREGACNPRSAGYKERDRLWKRLEKSSAVRDYQRPNDAKRYDIHLRDGLIIIVKEDNTTEELTVDSFLYLWLEGSI